jgi:hypothetical protein
MYVIISPDLFVSCYQCQNCSVSTVFLSFFGLVLSIACSLLDTLMFFFNRIGFNSYLVVGVSYTALEVTSA